MMQTYCHLYFQPRDMADFINNIRVSITWACLYL